MKGKYRSGQLYNATDTMTNSDMRTNWSLFAEVLMAEAGEAHVKYRAFSLSRFISFLCNGRHPANALADLHVHQQDVT